MKMFSKPLTNGSIIEFFYENRKNNCEEKNKKRNWESIFKFQVICPDPCAIQTNNRKMCYVERIWECPIFIENFSEKILDFRAFTARKIIIGKNVITDNASNKPFIHRWLSVPTLGKMRIIVSRKYGENAGKAIREFFSVRKRKSPAKNGNNNRISPIWLCPAASDHPPVISPVGLVIQKKKRKIPVTTSRIQSEKFENFLMKTAYRI